MQVLMSTISADEAGIIEYWSGIKNDLGFPSNVDFEYKTDTDLFEFVMVSGKTAPWQNVVEIVLQDNIP